MNLTKEEIVAIAENYTRFLKKEALLNIADRLEDIVGTHFHDAIYDVYLQRPDPHPDENYSDEDIQKIKDELKRTL